MAEVQWEDVRVDGSLLVNAEAPLGGDPAGALEASSAGDDDGAAVGVRRRVMRSLRMRGVRFQTEASIEGCWNHGWSASLTRNPDVLRGNEFDAEGVALEGDVRYDVPRMEAGVDRRRRREEVSGGGGG